MSITREESQLLDTDETPLQGNEKYVIDCVIHDLFTTARQNGVPIANDDRCAKLEAALIKLIIESRK